MTNQDNRPKDAADLRQKAEALAREQAGRTSEDSAALSPEEIRKTLHELRVHQIELEMQNEELRTAQAEIEAGRARYFDLYDLAPVGYCTPVSEKGLILEANLTAATLLSVNRGALVKQPISRFILKDDQDIYYLHRKKLTSSMDEVFADVLDILLKALDSRFGYFGYIDEAGDLVCPSMTRGVWDQCQVAEKSIVFPRAVWGGLWGRSLMQKQTLLSNEDLRVPEGT